MRGRGTRYGTLLVLIPALALTLGSSPPEVDSLRVPSNQVNSWFKPGTELKRMPADDFDALLRAAREGAGRRPGPRPPRLLRCRHRAKWVDGKLVGGSELVIAPPERDAADLPLEPWTPAVEGTSLRATDDGRQSVRVEPGRAPVTIVLSWRLRAREGSQGREFTVGLPPADISEFRVELPSGWEPQGPTGLRRGPEGGAWSFFRAGGDASTFDLTVAGPEAQGKTAPVPRLWCEGDTRVEVDDSGARWAFDASLQGGPKLPAQVVFDLDPGLELVNVTGPLVEEFRPEPTATSTRVRVGLRGEAREALTTTVSIAAVTRVPSEGRWLIPSARAVDAVWTGGTTTVRLGATRVVEAVAPQAGRRVAARRPATPGAATDDRVFVFESERPGSVAGLTFRKLAPEVSASVRGLVVAGNAAARLNCRVTWNIRRGQSHSLDIDLPASWSPDGVEAEGTGEAVEWFPETLPGGGVRIHVTSPSGDWSARPLVLTVTATSTVPGGRGELLLPRVRPVGAMVVDETWLARGEPGFTLRPTRANGLAWLDPARVATAPALDGAEDASRPALAWRWTEESGEARVDRLPSGQLGWGSVQLVASLTADRLRVDARVIPAASDGPTIVGLSEAVDDASAWRFFDERTGAEVLKAPADPRSHPLPRAPSRKPAWNLPSPPGRRGSVAYVARYEGPWGGQGQLPLIVFPESAKTHGVVLIRLAPNLRGTLDTDGVRVLDGETVAQTFAPETPNPTGGSDPDRPAFRVADAFAYEGGAARVGLHTDPLQGESAGLILDAVLNTSVDPSGSRGDRLVLRILPGASRNFELTPPPGMTLDRVARDGQLVTPTRAGDGLLIPLGAVGNGPARSVVTLAIDSHSTPTSGLGSLVVRPEKPGFSLPCLSLLWDLDMPESWRVADWGPSWTPADPSLRRAGLLERLGLRPSPWALTRTRARAVAAGGTAMRADLDARALALGRHELTLGEWFTRWDAGPWPLVIDRLALASAGYGPGSRVTPTRVDPDRPGASDAMLRPLGLAVIPAGGVLIVSRLSEQVPPEALASWRAATSEAISWGADASGRFESVPRWVEGAAPGRPVPPTSRASERRTSSKFVATGWPTAGDEVLLADRQSETTRAWAAGLIVLGFGGLARKRSKAVRASTLTATFVSALLATAFLPPLLASTGAGATYGASGLLLAWLGSTLPSLPARRSRPSRSTPPARRLAATLTPVVGLVLAVVAGSPFAPAQGDGSGRIVVLFPYDGAPDPDRAPETALLRLDDYRKLQALSDTPPLAARPAPRATEARHTVVRRGPGDLVVESEHGLTSEGGGESSWAFPVSDSRAISATVDGVEVPVMVLPGGKRASVRVPADGKPRRVVIKRSVVVRETPVGESMSLEVNPVASARVSVEKSPGGFAVELPTACDETVTRDGLATGVLGPVDRLEVRWVRPGRVKPEAVPGNVETLYLWDATPCGDRVRARMTCKAPGGTSLLRLKLGPDLLVRAISVPGTFDSTWEGTPGEPVWVGRFNPPLPEGTVVAIDAWRPLDQAPAQGGLTRRLPLIEPLGVDRSSSSLAFRRPPDWSGRITPGDGSDVLGEDAFVRLWGNLPAEPYTLSGAVKLPAPFARQPLPEVATGPRPSRVRVTPAVEVDVSPGRIDLAMTAELVETDEPVFGVEVLLPPGLKPVRVSGDGLTDWSIRDPRTLRLRFDGPPLPRRKIRLNGWIATGSESSESGPPAQSVAVPWPRWVGQEERPGTLTVRGLTPFDVLPGKGLRVVASEKGTPSLPGRTVYRVDRLDDHDRLRWEPEPPQVSVTVLSQITVEPGTAEWCAVVRYDVAGGPLETINLRVPTEWAKAATVEVEGMGHQLKESRGETTQWLIRPDRPVWGTQRVLIRSSVPFRPGEVRAFPELTPLGRSGAVDQSLRVVRATADAVVVVPSAGLLPIAPASFLSGDDLGALALRGEATHAYRVSRSGWSLRLGKPPEPSPGVGQAEITCALAPDGSSLGFARFDLAGPAQPFLGLDLADGSRPLAALVNGLGVPTFPSGTNHWDVPVSQGGRVDLIWKSSTPRGNALLLPALASGRAHAVVTVYAPEGVQVAGSKDVMTPTTLAAIDLRKADGLRRRLSVLAGRVKTSDRKGTQELVSGLVRFELMLRQSERASPTARTRQAAKDIRDRLADDIRAAGLEPALRSANVQLGLAPEAPPVKAPTPEPYAGLSIPSLGQSHAFEGVLSGRGEGPALSWSRVPKSGSRPGWRIGWLALGVACAASAWPLARLLVMRRWVPRTLLALVLASVAVWSGPMMFVCGTTFALAGWGLRSRTDATA